MTFQSVTSSTGFTIASNTCTSTLAANQSCAVTLTFAPSTAGTVTGSLSVVADTGTLSAALSGVGTQTPGVLSLSATSLDFGSVAVGATSRQATLTILNTGQSALTLRSITSSTGFTIASNTCASTLVANQSCVVTLTFTPSTAGTVTGSLSVVADTGTLSAALSGVGTQTPGALSLSATSLYFGSVAVGATSRQATLTILNTGQSALTLRSITSSTGFTIASNTCTSTLAANQSCVVTLTFTPSTAGAVTGSLSVVADTGTLSAALSGVGTQNPGVLSLSATSLDFGSVEVGDTTQQSTLSILNHGQGTLTLRSVTPSAGFAVASNACTSTLAPNQGCVVTLSFAPTTAGSVIGSLSVTADTGTVSAALSGVGTETLTILGSQSYIRPGDQVHLTAMLHGAVYPAVVWGVATSAGTIDSTGTLVASSSIPTPAPIAINARAATTSTIAGALQLPVWPALPSLSSSSPAAIPAGATTTLLINGSHLDTVTTLLLNGTSIPFTVVSANQLQSSIALPSWQQDSVNLVAELGGPQGGDSAPLPLAVQSVPITADAATRFLQQAAFGGNASAIAEVQQLGFSAWIDKQLQTPAYDYTSSVGVHNGQWYRNTQVSSTALRQRTSLALSEIYVLGFNTSCELNQCGPLWESILEKDAFGNARDLLTDVALSPMMGVFLDNGNNIAGTSGYVPNQNFAREVMQLMTIGTVQLDDTGQPLLDANGNQIPTYTQNNIADMASALSGWLFPGTLPCCFQMENALTPMTMADTWHDQGAKNILPGVQLPAMQGGTADFKQVLDTLFQHQNYAPFLSRRLIQHFVKSNPSPQYIQRVAAVFAADSHGVRGNLGAVVKAILLDKEARLGDDPTQAPDPTAGHLMEPILYIANVMNTVGVTFTDDQVASIDAAMGQSLYIEPDVFSYYDPNHQLEDGTPAPEEQLLDNAHVLAGMSIIYNAFHQGTPGLYINWPGSPFWNCVSTDDLLDRINHALYHGTMSASDKKTISDYLATIPSSSINDLVPDALFLAVSSSSYKVIR
jgi:uncharacterized protein (DUF1800 family)